MPFNDLLLLIVDADLLLLIYENWMVIGDDGSSIKYWKTNMNNVKANKAAQREVVPDLSFCRADSIFFFMFG